MLISIVVPSFDRTENIAAIVSHLKPCEEPYELILVDSRQLNEQLLDWVGGPVRLISASTRSYEAQLNAGAAAAKGDVILFLHPLNQLAPKALDAIKGNYQMLPQTIGGNFHVKFKQMGWFGSWLTRILKMQRYRGVYYHHTGFFVRRAVFEELSGFKENVALADVEFAQRLDRQGPTLALPGKITAPSPSVQQIFIWMITPMLVRFGIAYLIWRWNRKE